MRAFSKILAATGLSASMMLASVPAHAVTLVPFAAYTMRGQKTTIDWTKTGPLKGKIFSTLPGGSSPGVPTVTFNFLDTTKYLDNLQAKLTLTGSETGFAGTSAVDQGGIGGTFTFLYTGANQSFMGKNYVHNSTVLLKGVYTLADISGAGSSGSFSGSSLTGTVKFSSDIIGNLGLTKVSDFSFSLVSIGLPLSYTPGQSINSFKAGATGIFSTGVVPEPATWAMMISGFGLLGLAARRRRAIGLAAA
jgi:hypothetical protein